MNTSKYIYVLLLLVGIFFVGCSSHDTSLVEGGTNGGTENNGGDNLSNPDYFRLYLDVPKESAGQSATRASMMDENATYKIDFKQTKILLFKDNKYYKECFIDQDKIKFDEFSSQYELWLKKLDQSVTVDFVLIANEEVAMPTPNMDKEKYLEMLTFNVKGKWDVESPRLIPMWGEVKDVKLDAKIGVASHNGKLLATLIRSMARVDVTYDDSVLTADEFYIFRSNNKAFIAPARKNYNAEEQVVIAPTIPGSTGFNHSSDEATDDQYKNLLFVENGLLGDGGLTLIPEQKANVANPIQNICLVVRAYAENAEKASYYRIDFQKSVDGEVHMLDILRNHRYVFSIKGILGDGYDSPYEAAIHPSDGLMVDVVEYEENINVSHVSKGKYFALDNSIVTFFTGKKGEIQLVNFSTNYDVETLKAIQESFNWYVGADYFKASFDVRNRKIKVETLKDNYSSDGFKGYLKIKVKNYVFELTAYQNKTDLPYSLLCDRTSVVGDYRVGMPLTNQHYVDVVLLSTEQLTEGDFEVSTNKKNGISFAATGTFNMSSDGQGGFVQYVRLSATGTPITEEDTELILKIVGVEADACTVVVPVKSNKASYEFTPKFIVGVDANRSGSVLESGVGATFRKSTYNFGLESYSTIKISPLVDLPYSTQQIKIPDTGGYAFFQAQNQNYADLFNNKRYDKQPDVVIVGGAVRMEQKFAEQLHNYMQKGGTVIVMMNKGQDVGQLLKRFGVSDPVSVNSRSVNYPLIKVSADDPIYNGPFGSLEHGYWGAPGESCGVGQLSNSFIGYANTLAKGVSNPQEDRGVGIFRAKELKLFFVGNAEFVNSSVFGIDGQGKPILKNYNGVQVNNSILFGNALVWGLMCAEDRCF